ncbi:MAG: nucleotidyl transferase AbiEii/AbiGii toxin family protein [Bacteroidales bacterium]|nr:nucleotidyl transferase AbiEii/AbiGii toxin family protein [Bacteroidales bacterium]
MNNLLKKLMPSPMPETTDAIITALREILQSIALLGLWRAKFFEHAAFYGGTALRILYGLDRFSEDLDFSLLTPSDKFSFYAYSSALRKELNAYGFDIAFETKQKTNKSAVESAFLKGNTFNQLIVINAPEQILSGINKQSVIKIKLEIDTNPPLDFNTEMKYLFSPVQFAVRSYTLPSLFAGKMHALLCRKWENRVKGRDWYDFAWYISNYPQLNILHLEKRMRQSGHYTGSSPLTRDYLIDLLYANIDNLDIAAARKDVTPFINNINSLDIWSVDFFKAAAQKIDVKPSTT